MPKASISFQLLPQTNMKEAYRIVDRVLDMISAEEHITYVVGPMDTVIEGELGQLLEIVRKAVQIGHDEGVSSVFSVLKLFSGTGDLGCGLLDSVRPAMEKHNV